MRIIGFIEKRKEENVVKVFADDGKEIVGVSRLFIKAKGRDVIVTFQMLSILEPLSEKAVYFRGEKYKLEKNGKGFRAMRDPKTQRFVLDQFDGIADIEIKKV